MKYRKYYKQSSETKKSTGLQQLKSFLGDGGQSQNRKQKAEKSKVFRGKRWNICLSQNVCNKKQNQREEVQGLIIEDPGQDTLDFVHQESTLGLFSEWQSFSRVQLFVTPWTVAHQAPLCIEFFRQEYWRGYPFHSPVFQPRSNTTEKWVSE